MSAVIPQFTDTNSSSRTDLAVRAKANQIEVFIIRFALDQNQIKLDMAVSMIRPFAWKWMIEMAAGQRDIWGKQIYDFHQGGIKRLAVPPWFFPFVIALESTSFPLLPRHGCPAFLSGSHYGQKNGDVLSFHFQTPSSLLSAGLFPCAGVNFLPNRFPSLLHLTSKKSGPGDFRSWFFRSPLYIN
jgi:hypothetical protein